MDLEFDPRQIPSEQYRERIRALENRLAEEQAALRKTEAELAWWRQGLDLFADGKSDGDTAATGKKPTLRDAILRILNESDKAHWRTPDVIEQLSLRGWMPNGNNAEHIVRGRLSKLVREGDLERPSYGLYALPPGEEAMD